MAKFEGDFFPVFFDENEFEEGMEAPRRGQSIFDDGAHDTEEARKYDKYFAKKRLPQMLAKKKSHAQICAESLAKARTPVIIYCVVCGETMQRDTDIADRWAHVRRCPVCLSTNRRSVDVRFCRHCGKKIFKKDVDPASFKTISVCDTCRS